VLIAQVLSAHVLIAHGSCSLARAHWLVLMCSCADSACADCSCSLARAHWPVLIARVRAHCSLLVLLLLLLLVRACSCMDALLSMHCSCIPRVRRANTTSQATPLTFAAEFARLSPALDRELSRDRPGPARTPPPGSSGPGGKPLGHQDPNPGGEDATGRAGSNLHEPRRKTLPS
jgi:hypothetical protein